MKRIILFLAVCLGLSVSQTTFADTSDTVRAAAKRTSSVTTSNTQTANRSVASSAKRQSNTNQSQKASRNTTQNQQKVSSRSNTKQQNVTSRTTTKTQPAQTSPTRITTTSRTTSSRNVNPRASESIKPYINSAVVKVAPAGKKPTRTTVRAADLDAAKINDIKSLNYSKCKTVYYECMDEFCANKDTNLRRCACSSRIHEFDGIKKQLENAEDKMLDFNQRLLTVSLDKEDAAAINQATEGELAFNKKDSSESEKLLQKITNALNSSGDSRINNNMSSISLSLDMENAWDNIDSLSGIATSSKNGLDLYNAARPVCIEMAKEVCSDDELNIAQNGYKLTIQQDCDTVAKAYKTQYNNAMEKIHESSALLDMSRLNVHQQKNSDDTLTCRKKILEQLSDSSVCGENLYKCLDTTGQYIDPSNGSAFLSKNLHNLTNLLAEPGADEKWSTVKQNQSFVKFLNSKKEFLKPAIAQCQNMSDMIWKDFLNDALSQIKLAQNAKIEEVKRSCTELVKDCKSTALKDLSDFDARALSTFSVAADKTVNAMCSEITNSCASLMDISDASGNWKEGIENIAYDQTIQTVMEECMNVGRNCIIQQCNATSGNFALCQDETSDIRIRILEEEACYTEVKECIANADGIDTEEGVLIGDGATILANLWGECTDNTTTGTIKSGSSLLSWFATNSGLNSCNTTGCKYGYKMENGICEKIIGQTTSDCANTDDCQKPNAQIASQVVHVAGDFTNYCEDGVRDIYGNCCVDAYVNNGICVPQTRYYNAGKTKIAWTATPLMDLQCTPNANNIYLCTKAVKMTLYCISGGTTTPIVYYPETAEYECVGTNSMWVIVDENGNYFKAEQSIESDKTNNDGTTQNNVMMTTPRPMMYYQNEIDNNRCEYVYDRYEGWHFEGNCSQTITTPPTDNEFLIKYDIVY